MRDRTFAHRVIECISDKVIISGGGGGGDGKEGRKKDDQTRQYHVLLFSYCNSIEAAICLVNQCA